MYGKHAEYDFSSVEFALYFGQFSFEKSVGYLSIDRILFQIRYGAYRYYHSNIIRTTRLLFTIRKLPKIKTITKGPTSRVCRDKVIFYADFGSHLHRQHRPYYTLRRSRRRDDTVRVTRKTTRNYSS